MPIIQELVSRLGFEVDDTQLNHLHHKIDGIAESVKVLAGIEIAKMLYELAERFAGFGEHLESAAIQAGLTAEELQKLQYAASQNAVSADELSGGMARLGRILFQAQKGSKAAVDAFSRLGIDKATLNSFGSTEEALYAIQDGIGGVATQQEKLAVVQQLFGRGGSKFLKFLQVGSEGTKALGNEAQRVGAIVSSKNIEDLAYFEDATVSLGQVIKSFFATVAGTIAPAFTRAVKTLQNAWAANREAVMSGLKQMAGGFAYYMGVIIVLVREVGKTIHSVIYAEGGIVGAIKSVARFLKEYVGQAFSDLFRDIQDANKDGSITSVFTELVALITSLTETAKSLFAALDQVFGALTRTGEVDTSKISAIAWVFQKLANIISTVLYGLNNLSDWFNFALKGGFGDMLGEKIFGDFGSKQGLSSVRSVAQQSSAVQGVATGLGIAPTIPQAAAAGAPMSQASPSPQVSISSPINVYAAPGMDEKSLADLVVKKQGSQWEQMMKQTDRDFSFGHVR